MIPDAVSFWQASLGPPPARPALDGSVQADVCIVGAGYTGLWTARALAAADPTLRIVVVEAAHVGFGASGRNGGWLSGLMPGDRDRLARESAERAERTGGRGGRAGVRALQRQLIDAVGEVVAACVEEGIEADIRLGGTMAVATAAAQLGRLRSSLEEDRVWGVGPDDQWELSAGGVRTRLAVAHAVGGVYSPHCARIHPAKLVRGLADAVERRGVTIYERTPALALVPEPPRPRRQPGWTGPARTGPLPIGTFPAGAPEPTPTGPTVTGPTSAGAGPASPLGRVRTPTGDVRARWIVRATEGFTATLPGEHRRLLPMNSSMIVTDPLPPEAWARLGWDGAETVRDAAHVYAYAQRTADGRIAIGGRGVPYRFGSRILAATATPAGTGDQLAATLRRLLPDVGTVPVAHLWSGVLGVARDWCPAIGVAATASGEGGLIWAGGYIGDGVTTSYLAGLTMADIILGRPSPRTELPWVNHRSRVWEPEPLRWLGVRGVYALYRAADRAESRHPTRAATSPWAAGADVLSGRRVPPSPLRKPVRS